jgi:hypothetical protein
MNKLSINFIRKLVLSVDEILDETLNELIHVMKKDFHVSMIEKILAFLILVNQLTMHKRSPYQERDNLREVALFTINDIANDEQFIEIIVQNSSSNLFDYKQNKFNNVIRNEIPLSHYIIVSKLYTHRQSELNKSHIEEFECIATISNAIVSNERPNKVMLRDGALKIPQSEHFTFDSNLGQNMAECIILVIRYAFTIHASKRSLCDLIIKKLPKIDSIKWECHIEMMKNGEDKSNAKEMPMYFCAYYFDKLQKLSAYISVYAILIDKRREASEILKLMNSFSLY